jgi:DNA-directed RNA polymerase
MTDTGNPGERRIGERTIRPVPDPTLLTTEALHREALRLEVLIGERIESLDTLIQEKFRSVDQQLDLVERQRVEQKSDTKAAVDAALTAQKEAVREQTLASEKAIQKSETSTTKQLEQITVTFTTALHGITTALEDIKERVSKIEAIKIGGNEAKTGLFALAGFILTVLLIGGMIAAAGLLKK